MPYSNAMLVTWSRAVSVVKSLRELETCNLMTVSKLVDPTLCTMHKEYPLQNAALFFISVESGLSLRQQQLTLMCCHLYRSFVQPRLQDSVNAYFVFQPH
jgi:hypothetical protein